LNSKNKATPSNILAIPVLVYSFGIVSWLRKEIEKINRKTGKILWNESTTRRQTLVDSASKDETVGVE
jgi:hypothetical protein